jgi:enoyl-CoA hydratase
MVEEVLVERRDAALRVTLNRPEKHNALSRSVLETLRTVFIEHAADETLKVAVLTGAGNQSFAAGGDLKDLSTVRTLAEAREMAEQAKAALEAVRVFPVPVVAALNGNAMGGGAELAVACDFRIAAAGAKIGFVQGRLNISTAWGGGVDLMRLIGPDRALRLLCSSEMVSPAQALSIGLCDAVAPDVGLYDAVGDKIQNLEIALDEFLQPFLRQAPQVLRTFKAVVAAGRRGIGRNELHELETEHFAANWVHPDHWTAADRILEKTERKG